MHIDISARGMEITEAIRDYAERKLSALSRFLRRVDDLRASVILGKETAHHRDGEVFTVEVELFADGKSFYSDETGENLYAAIDIVQAELERMITTEKEKRGNLVRRGGRKVKEMFQRFYRA